MGEVLTLDALKEAISTGVKEGLPKPVEPEKDKPEITPMPELKADQLVGLDEDGTPIVKSRQDVLLEQYEASMGQGLLVAIERPINQAAPADIKLGSIGVGAFSALVIGELVDGFVPAGVPGAISPGNLVTKGIAAFGLTQFGPMLMSRDATRFAVAVLVTQIIADLVPLERWVNNLVNFVRQPFGGGGAVAQAERVARDYQARHLQPSNIVPPEQDQLRNMW